MSIKEHIEKHPIISLVISSTAVCVVAVAVVNYLSDKQIVIIEATCKQERAIAERASKDKISDLQEQLTYIKRGLGTREDWIDVRSFILQGRLVEGNTPGRINRSDYWREEGFYALRPENASNWKYKKMSSPEFVGLILKKDPLEIEKAQTTGLKNIPLYVWHSNTTSHIERSPIIKRAFPYITVRIIPNSALRSLANGQLSAMAPQPQLMVVTPEGETQTGDMTREGDLSGTFLALQLKEELLEPAPGVTSWLTSLQKQENILFAQIDTILRDVRVNGLDMDKFYLTREIFVFSGPKGLFVIKTMVPSSDRRRSADAAWITTWLNSFLIDIGY